MQSLATAKLFILSKRKVCCINILLSDKMEMARESYENRSVNSWTEKDRVSYTMKSRMLRELVRKSNVAQQSAISRAMQLLRKLKPSKASATQSQ